MANSVDPDQTAPIDTQKINSFDFLSICHNLFSLKSFLLKQYSMTCRRFSAIVF